MPSSDPISMICVEIAEHATHEAVEALFRITKTAPNKSLAILLALAMLIAKLEGLRKHMTSAMPDESYIVELLVARIVERKAAVAAAALAPKL